VAYEASVQRNGGHVHWASTSEELAATVVEICREAGAKTVTKGKSIIQLAKEPPSHIIAPAVHKTKEQVADLFHEHHAQYGLTERLIDRTALVNEARTVLREKFRAARVQIVIVGIEKVIPTLEDASAMLRLLARSATGQHFSNYTSLMSGPRRDSDTDGPDAFHVVLVDKNHCPVYGAVGGHAYGWVYPGPMGSVVTPAMIGVENARDLPHACTLNGRCGEVCPMRIPLPKLLRRHRQTTFEEGLQSPGARYGLGLWASVYRHLKVNPPS